MASREAGRRGRFPPLLRTLPLQKKIVPRRRNQGMRAGRGDRKLNVIIDAGKERSEAIWPAVSGGGAREIHPFANGNNLVCHGLEAFRHLR